VVLVVSFFFFFFFVMDVDVYCHKRARGIGAFFTTLYRNTIVVCFIIRLTLIEFLSC
jgi:hypothetical protein